MTSSADRQGTGAPAPAGAAPRSAGGRLVALALDAAAIVVFAYLGRGAHEGGRSLGEVLEVALPFLLVRLAVTFVVRDGLRLWPGGVVTWLLTWAAGMALRAVLGGGTALPFVLVALGVLGAFLLGWRLVLLIAQRVRARG